MHSMWAVEARHGRRTSAKSFKNLKPHGYKTVGNYNKKGGRRSPLEKTKNFNLLVLAPLSASEKDSAAPWRQPREI